MPPTLESVAEEISPSSARTNYFDVAGGDDVIARYGNARRGVESSEFAANAATRLTRSREDRLMGERRRIDWDREDQEHAEKQDFKAQRGQFLETISMIDPEADDFEEQISTIYKTLPPGARDDDAVGALISWKQKVYQDRLNEKDMQARREDAFNDRRALMMERYANDPRLASLTPDDRKQFISPDGSFDHVGAAQLAYQRSRGDKQEDSKERTATVEETRNEREARKERKEAVTTLIRGDRGAFPSQIESLRAASGLKNKKVRTDDDLKKDFPAEYAAAAAYDKDPEASEFGSALNAETADAYVAMGGDKLSDTQKRKRRQVWEEANRVAGEEAPQPDVGKPVSKAPAVLRKVLDGVTYEKTPQGWAKVKN